MEDTENYLDEPNVDRKRESESFSCVWTIKDFLKLVDTSVKICPNFLVKPDFPAYYSVLLYILQGVRKMSI